MQRTFVALYCLDNGWACTTQEIEGASQAAPTAAECQEYVQNALANHSVSVDSPRGQVIPLEQAKAQLNERLSEEQQRVSWHR